MSGFEGQRMTIYNRKAVCTKGHCVDVSFTWEPDGTSIAREYSQPCTTAGCDGRVEGKLPAGADFGSLALDWID